MSNDIITTEIAGENAEGAAEIEKNKAELKRKHNAVIRRVLIVLLSIIFTVSVFVLLAKISDEKINNQENMYALQIAGLTNREKPSAQISNPSANRENSGTAGISGVSGNDSGTIAENELEEDDRITSIGNVEIVYSLPSDLAYLEHINFEELREVNEDVEGWIVIPDTEVSYPLMQSEDNTYYLTHTWQNNYNSGGSVFLDYRSELPSVLIDGNTGYVLRMLKNSAVNSIVYGHRMRNNSMFGSLKYYSDLGYWEDHPSVYIICDGIIYRYDIFAAWTAPVDSGAYNTAFEYTEDYGNLLEKAVKNSAIDTGIVPSTDDKILTLSTCTGLGYSSRWVVQAVLAQICSQTL